MITLGKCLKHDKLLYSNEPHGRCGDYDGDASQKCGTCSAYEYRMDVPGYGTDRRGMVRDDCDEHTLDCYHCGDSNCANQGEY